MYVDNPNFHSWDSYPRFWEIPDLDEYRLSVPEKFRINDEIEDASTWFSIDAELEAIKLLGLEAHRDEAHGLWLGLPVDDVHPHDRWYFYSPIAGTPHGAVLRRWYGYRPVTHTWRALASFTTNLQSRSIGYKSLNSKRFNEDLPGLSTVAKLVLMPLLRGDRRFKGLSSSQILTSHDAIYHPDRWRADHDMAGLPHDLILRMHGLGEYPQLLEHVID